MTERLSGIASGFLVALMFAAALWAIDALPPDARVAIHWGSNGVADGWMGKWAGLLFIPVLGACIWFIGAAFPRGWTIPGKPELPPHARRVLFVCVLFVEAVAELAIVFNAVRAAGS